MADQRPEVLVKNQVDGVLQDYLDQLLVVATEARPAPAGKETVKETSRSLPEECILEDSTPADTSQLLVDGEIQGWDIEETAAPEVKEAETQQAVSVPTTVDELPGIADAGPESAVSPSGLNWSSSQGVECLIFKVAGLKLAIPLPLLGGVFPVEGKVTPLFGQAKWSLGVWQSDGEKMTVIDSAQLIMPERGASLADSGYEYLIQLDRAPWALACEEICDTVTLMNESIKWRGDLSKRPWLAGTVISEMCALLDVPGLIELADSQRKAS